MKFAIIGENASGKTVKLLSFMEHGIYSRDYISNIDVTKNPFLKLFKVNNEKLAIAEDILECEFLHVSQNTLVVLDNDLDYSSSFLQMMYLLCLDTDRLYLDNPEFYCKDYVEIGKLSSLFAKTVRFFKDIVVVTHSELFLNLGGMSVKTVVDGELVDVIRGTEREIID